MVGTLSIRTHEEESSRTGRKTRDSPVLTRKSPLRVDETTTASIKRRDSSGSSCSSRHGVEKTRMVRLASLCVGMWKSRRHASLWMIIVSEQQKFVFVVEHDDSDVGAGVLRQFGAESPFASSKKHQRSSGMTVAFEVGFENVTGVNYTNPLVRKGRMVVEACYVVKKEFPCMEDVLMYYNQRDDGARPCGCEEATSPPVSTRYSTKKNLLASMDTVAGNESFEFDVVQRPPSFENEKEFREYDAPVKVYSFRSISIEWTDVHVPCALLPVFEAEERLLKMYESGLPTWAMLLPAYGFYYRPWLRSLTWVLFYVFSIFSLAMGFWDLYKTLPGLQEMLAKIVGSLWLPPTAVLQWIEEHAQIRLSILLTYLFGKSEIFVFVMRHVGLWWRSVCALIEPLYGSTMGPMLLFLKVTGFQAIQLASTVANSTVVPVVVFVRNAFGVIVTPLLLLWRLVKQSWSALSLIFGTFFSSGSNSAAVTGGWLFWALPADAVRASLVRALRALTSVWKFTVNVCNGISRHRLTLSRRFRRWRIRCTDQLSRIAMALFWKIVDFFMTMYEYLPRHSSSRSFSGQKTHEVADSFGESNDACSAAEQTSLSFSKAFLSENGLRHRHALEDTADSKVTST